MQESGEQVPVVNQCPECSHSMDVSHLPPFAKIECPSCKKAVRVRTQMGQYHINGVLGEGGMSQVFRAVDINLGREVALKVLHQALSQDSALTAMFEREAKLTASILHPNVVKVYTVGKDQGYFFIAMELVDATSLEELIAQRGAIPEADVLRIAYDVTNGLKAAYQEDLIHRDIKPGNMLTTPEGTSKLVDFGLAVQQGGEDESEDLWATPFYVPPEKLEGESDTYLGDIYSLGATLFHALAGHPPFDANTSSLEELKIIKAQSVDLKSQTVGLTKGTLRLIEQMMAYRASDRPDSYDTILKRIEDIQKREFGVRHRSQFSRSSKRKKGLIIGIGAAAFLGIVGLIAFGPGGSSETEAIGIGGGDRVISAGENSSAEKFLQGRELLSKGDFRKSGQIFEELARESALSPLTEQWNLFFLGTSKLFLGEAQNSQGAFRKITTIELDAEAAESSAADFLKIAARQFSSPLPVLAPESAFEGNDIAPLGMLVAGLKNWQDGQFESGVKSMKVFAESEAPEEYKWSEGLKKEIARFTKDYATLSELPNPSRSNSEMPLGEQKTKLTEAKESLRTRGALPSLIDDRIERIAEISNIIAREKRKREEAARLAQAAPSPPTDMEEPEEGPSEKPSPEAIAETEAIRELVAGLPNSDDDLAFTATRNTIGSMTVETGFGQQLVEDLTLGGESAARFIDLLASELNSVGYEGNIRRREGVPLDAKITAADPGKFIVDLGFGPNEVAVDTFSPDWLVEAAEATFPPPTNDDFRKWESLVYFALFSGLTEESERISKVLTPVSDEFAETWNRLGEVR